MLSIRLSNLDGIWEERRKRLGCITFHMDQDPKNIPDGSKTPLDIFLFIFEWYC